MRDITKKLTVLNTGNRPVDNNSGQSESATTVIGIGGGGGMLTGEYLLQSIWDRVWEIRTDSSGAEYIFGKLPVVTQYGVTMYAGDNVDIPSFVEGLPFDQQTIWYNPTTKQIEVIGSTGGGTADAVAWDKIIGKPTWIGSTKPTYSYSEIQGTPDLSKYALASEIPSLSGYATEQWVLGKGYALSSDLTALSTKLNDFLEGSDTDTIINKWKELETFLSGLSESDNLATILETKSDKTYVDESFVTIKGDENVTGLHDFVNGLKVGGMKISKSQDDVVYLDGNLVVRGGITMYALDDVTVDSIIDKLPTSTTTTKGIASFNPEDFVVEDGHVSLNEDNQLTELSKLKDVSIDDIKDGEALVYNSETSTWENMKVDSDKTFYYEQQVASAVWKISHNLSKRPSVMVFDSANDEVHGDIVYNDNNNITLSFSSSFSGTAILN